MGFGTKIAEAIASKAADAIASRAVDVAGSIINKAMTNKTLTADDVYDSIVDRGQQDVNAVQNLFTNGLDQSGMNFADFDLSTIGELTGVDTSALEGVDLSSLTQGIKFF